MQRIKTKNLEIKNMWEVIGETNNPHIIGSQVKEYIICNEQETFFTDEERGVILGLSHLYIAIRIDSMPTHKKDSDDIDHLTDIAVIITTPSIIMMLVKSAKDVDLIIS